MNNNNANGQRQATNNEIMDVLQRLVRKNNSLETELHNVKTEIRNVRAEMQDMKDELKRDMRDLKDELKQRQDDFEKKIEDRIAKFERENDTKAIIKEAKEQLSTPKLIAVGAIMTMAAYGAYQLNNKPTEKDKKGNPNKKQTTKKILVNEHKKLLHLPAINCQSLLYTLQ